MKISAASFIKDLSKKKKSSQVQNLQRFYKGPKKDGLCLGVPMGMIFTLAKQSAGMPISEIKKLLKSPIYEVRMGAVSIMDFQARNKNTSDELKKQLYSLYMGQHDRINNWDLVDRAAPHVVGAYLFKKSRKPLYQLVKSKSPWERRTAIVSTYYFIKNGDIDETFLIAKKLVTDKDLYVQKALGGWIREAGKRDKQKLVLFLDENHSLMSAEAVRLATDKLSKAEKARFRAKLSAIKL